MSALRPKPAMRLAITRRLVDAKWVGRQYLSLRAVARPLLPHRDTEVYIDGFPRSANSYALYAFRASNPESQLAGHCHSADIIRAAVEMGIPVMLLVREPLPCAASFMRFVPGLSLESALRYYRRFHTSLQDVRGEICVANFDDVIADFGEVLRRFNEVAGTAFVPYFKSPENEAVVADMLDHANSIYASGQSHTLARPTPARDSSVPAASELTAKEARLLAACSELYRELLG